MENRIEFHPEWLSADPYCGAWASWNLNGDTIVEYIERDFTPSMWFWDKYFVDLYEPTDEEICMFDLQFGEGMYDKITGLSLKRVDRIIVVNIATKGE